MKYLIFECGPGSITVVPAYIVHKMSDEMLIGYWKRLRLQPATTVDRIKYSRIQDLLDLAENMAYESLFWHDNSGPNATIKVLGSSDIHEVITYWTDFDLVVPFIQ